MKKFLAIFWSALILLSFVLAANIVFAERFLKEGEFKIVGSDPSAEDYINERLFQNATLSINGEGTMMGSANTSFTDLALNRTKYTGTASFTIDGNYDEEENRASGTFTTTQNATYINEAEGRTTILSGNFDLNFSGTFTGGASEDGVLVLDFKGTKSITGVDRSSNGNEISADRSAPWNSRVVFNDFGSLSVDGEEEVETEESESGEVEKSEVVIDKVVGDIIYSDPEKSAGVLTKSWRFLSGAYQDDPEQWRKWEQPEQGTILKKGARIITDLGMAKITLKDGSKFILRRGSEIKILGEGGIRVEKGSGYFVYPKTGERREVEAFDFKNVVRGTEFSVEIDGDKGEVKLVEGELEIIPPREESFILMAGESYEFNEDGSFEKGSFGADAEKKVWDDLEAEAPDVVTSDVNEPVWIILVGIVVVLLALIWVVLKVFKEKKK